MKKKAVEIGLFIYWITCKLCKKQYYGFSPNPHHKNVGMAIECDKCGRIVFFNNLKDPFIIKYHQEAPGNSTWQEFVDTFNNSLEPCKCGGRYEFHNDFVPTKCPHCEYIGKEYERTESGKQKAQAEGLEVNWMDRANGIGPNDES